MKCDDDMDNSYLDTLVALFLLDKSTHLDADIGRHSDTYLSGPVRNKTLRKEKHSIQSVVFVVVMGIIFVLVLHY